MKFRHITWASASIGASVLIVDVLGGPTWAGALVAAGSAACAAHWLRRATARLVAMAQQQQQERLVHTAHELRTPLASIVTVLEMLREGYARSPAETEEFLDLATFGAHHLGLLVNDVLDDAALTAGQLRLDAAPHRALELVLATTQLMDLQARARRIQLQISASAEDLWVRADPRRVRQILFNLVGNSMKFSAPGETVRIEVRSVGERVRMQVTDRGPGVPVALRRQLFTAFATDDGQAAGNESTGLGLHVSRRIVEHMGGRIGYEPAAERGSTFWFELPRAQPPGDATQPPGLPEPVPAETRVPQAAVADANAAAMMHGCPESARSPRSPASAPAR